MAASSLWDVGMEAGQRPDPLHWEHAFSLGHRPLPSLPLQQIMLWPSANRDIYSWPVVRGCYSPPLHLWGNFQKGWLVLKAEVTFSTNRHVLGYTRRKNAISSCCLLSRLLQYLSLLPCIWSVNFYSSCKTKSSIHPWSISLSMVYPPILPFTHLHPFIHSSPSIPHYVHDPSIHIHPSIVHLTSHDSSIHIWSFIHLFIIHPSIHPPVHPSILPSAHDLPIHDLPTCPPFFSSKYFWPDSHCDLTLPHMYIVYFYYCICSLPPLLPRSSPHTDPFPSHDSSLPISCFLKKLDSE